MCKIRICTIPFLCIFSELEEDKGRTREIVGGGAPPGALSPSSKKDTCLRFSPLTGDEPNSIGVDLSMLMVLQDSNWHLDVRSAALHGRWPPSKLDLWQGPPGGPRCKQLQQMQPSQSVLYNSLIRADLPRCLRVVTHSRNRSCPFVRNCQKES